MFIGSLVSLLGLGVLLWMLFTLAIYALPFFAAMSVGLHFYESGSGVFEAFALGFLAGVATLIIGQLLVAVIRNPWLQAGVALVYAAPAAMAGYYAVYGLSGAGFDSETARVVFGGIGAVIIGGTAWARMGDLFGGAPAPADSVEAASSPYP
ncbi:hypothetical protein AAD018_010430 [Aestuariibius insulae]|uniref:hypothetical protein n=1 Tax=Aestuariibius insulae TaxID=2058287 RepID=UPI00345E2E39